MATTRATPPSSISAAGRHRPEPPIRRRPQAQAWTDRPPMAPQPATPARPARAAFARARECSASAAVRSTAVPAKKSPARQSRYRQPVKAISSCLGPATEGIASADSNLLRDADKEAASWSELRCEHADAGPVPDLVNLVEQVHDVEAQRGRFGPSREKKLARDPGIDLGVGGQVIGIRKAGAKPAAVDHRGAEARAIPQIGGAGRRGQDLGMVGVDIVVGDKVYFVLSEQKLVRYDGGGDLFCPGDVSPGAEVAIGVGRFEFEADIFPAIIIEAVQHIGRAELAVVEQVARDFVVSVDTDFEAGYGIDLLHGAHIEQV